MDKNLSEESQRYSSFQKLASQEVIDLTGFYIPSHIQSEAW